MKTLTDVTWYPEAQVVCACGNIFTIGSTKQEMRVEICSRCHPFFTGETRFVDSLGRVERFQKKMTHAIANPVKKKEKKSKDDSDDQNPKTLREMLLELKK